MTLFYYTSTLDCILTNPHYSCDFILLLRLDVISQYFGEFSSTGNSYLKVLSMGSGKFVCSVLYIASE